MKLSFLASGNGKFRDKISECEIYIAIVTPSFVKDDKCLGEMKDAEYLKKKMFALVKHGTELPQYFFSLNWQLILFYATKKEYEMSCNCLKGFLENLKID